MHFNAAALAFCVLFVQDVAIARPTSHAVGQVEHPILRRGGKAAQLAAQPEQVSCVTPPAAGEEEAAAGEGEAVESTYHVHDLSDNRLIIN